MKKFENILVAFDLNKTLFLKTQQPLLRKHDKKIKRLHFYFRPYLQQLINFLHLNSINYCFWSNMLGKNCVKYIKQLETLGMTKYCGIFDQSFCDIAQNSSELGQKIKTVKNLQKLADLFQIDVDACILVDDSKQKNVPGCKLIEVKPYLGQENDKQMLFVIQKLIQYRKECLDLQQNHFPLLKYTDYKFDIPMAEQQNKNKYTVKIQKPHQLTDVQKEIQNDLQIQKLKKQLVLQKQIKKNTTIQIQILQKANTQLAIQIKKQSQGKVIRKGDQLLLQVFQFAKNKKTSQKKIQQLALKKKNAEDKIVIIKKLMRNIIQKYHLKHKQGKQLETKDETRQSLLSKQTVQNIKLESKCDLKQQNQLSQKRQDELNK